MTTIPASFDENRPFLPVQIAVLTVSDTRTPETDTSGDRLQALIEADGHSVIARTILKDDADVIAAQLTWIDDPAVDCVVTTGGTGITGRDVTPEAFDRVLEKQIDGFGEMFRWLSFRSSAPQRCNRGHWAGSRAEPTCSPCPAPPALSKTAGPRSCATSSITGTDPAIWSS